MQWVQTRMGGASAPLEPEESIAGSQYTSFRFTTHLLDAGIDASIGSVGDALDNA